MHDQTLEHYDKHAEAFSAQYQAAEPEALHKLLMRWLPSSGSIFEIGCGSGRDAIFMAGLGLDVIATDGSAGMLEQARIQASTLSAEPVSRLSFQHATFPLPVAHPLLAERFDAVVAIAILMHIPNQSFFDFAFQIRSLLKPRGRFICSFCAGRESSESDPRLYVNREPGEVRLIFERLGFVVLTQEDTEDSLKRGIRWTTLVFGCDHATGSRPVDQIEAVINHDKTRFIDCWQTARRAMPERFDIELNRTLFGRNHAEAQWEVPAFSAFAEAVETVALQRGVERWEPKGIAGGTHAEAAFSGAVGDRRPTYHFDSGLSRDSDAKKTGPDATERVPPGRMQPSDMALLSPEEIPRRAFIDALPIVGNLAASTTFFDGFSTGAITDVFELDWVAVPKHVCKPKRFVIRVAGDSMEPLFKVGDLLVFDYHRTPRRDGQIVIAADFTSGSGDYAVKRFKEHPTFWRFLSENPAYTPVEIEKSEMQYPILGTFVSKPEKEQEEKCQ